MLHGAVLRSPYAHARIKSINFEKAANLDGVKAIITRDDFPKDREGEPLKLLENTIAGEIAYYDGHAIAAVAATSVFTAKEALKEIEVEYEVLPHVIDVDDAMKPDAPIVRENAGDFSVPEGSSPNVASYIEFGRGDIANGFDKADIVKSGLFKTEAAHQGYIEPHACMAQLDHNGQGEMWVCTQGHWYIRQMCSEVLGLEASKLCVTPSEIGGGFGGKTTIFIEPLALALSKKSGGRPVKIVMSRSEVLRATGPTASASMDVKIGMTKDGYLTAGCVEFRMQGGAFGGSPVSEALQCAFASYNMDAVHHIGFDVLANRPRAAAYRAPGSPMAAFAVESLIDEMCTDLNLDPIDVRLKNAVAEGSKSSYGPKFKKIGLI